MTWVVLVAGIVVILAVDQVLRRRRRGRPAAVPSGPRSPRTPNPAESAGFTNHIDGGG